MALVEPSGSSVSERTRDDSDPLRRLAAWPEVLEGLRSRDGPLDPRRGLSGEELENRVGTQLMALWRDTRTDVAFEALYAFARPAVLRWIQSLLRRGRAHLDPAEMLQDTFVNVYRYPKSFRADHAGSFRVWVRTIAGNIVRRAGGRSSPVSFQELPEGFREPADERNDPERAAVVGEENARLRQAWLLFLCHYASAWEQLSVRDRRALELVEVEGHTYEVAGRILGVRRSNMKMIIFRSRKRIATRMRVAMRPASGSATGLRQAG